MRKSTLFLRCMALAAMTATIAACSDGKNEGGIPPVTPTEGISTEAFYKGDFYENGTGNLLLCFVTDMETDPDTNDYIGPGYVLGLDFNTTLAENADFATLAAGTYTGAESYESFTFTTRDEESYLMQYDAAGNSTLIEIVGGTVEVSLEQGYYHFEGTLRMDDGTDFPCSYVCKVIPLNRSQEGKMSNLTQDVTLNEFTQGMVIYCGNAFETSSDLYNVLLAGPDFDFDFNFGSSDDLMLALNVAPGASDGIPAGTYTIIDAPTATDFPAGTALSGFYDSVYATYGGTWFYSPQNGIESSIRGGNVTVTNDGNGSYSFDFRFEDGYGHKITGVYSGKCRVEDWS